MAKVWKKSASNLFHLVTSMLGLWLSCAVTAALSKEGRPTGIVGPDDRQPIISTEEPWRAVGQINIGGYNQRMECTGTLVAPRLVLTAAHCVVNRRTNAPFPAHTIYFVAGVHPASILAAGTALCVKVPDGFRQAHLQSPTIGTASSDIAIVVLKEPMNVVPAQLTEDAQADVGASLVHASYPADRRHQLMADTGCKLISSRAGAWLTTCDTRSASSGGPVFLKTSQGLRLAAIMIAVLDDTATVAAPISPWRNALFDTECAASH